jgi:hypothetical protein
MSSFMYLLLFIIVVVIILIVLFIKLYRKDNHAALYSEAVVHENEGHYDIALHQYEDALSVIRKKKPNDELDQKITQRIKILRATIDYEKNFQKVRAS